MNLRGHDVGGTGGLLSLLGLVLTVAAGACALKGPAIRLEGTPSAIEHLVGTWSGEYVSDTAAVPGGSIFFELVAGENLAYGNVLMTRRGAREPFGRYDPDRRWAMDSPPPMRQNLTILFVRAEGGTLSGELDPYWDFDRNCAAWTVFRGRLGDAVMEGTYETTFRGAHANAAGRWRVVRARATAGGER